MRVTFENQKLFLDPKDQMISKRIREGEIYEAQSRKLLMSRVRPGDVVVDGGAHIGIYTIAFALAVGKTGVVHAFEPSSRNREFLIKNVNENKHQNVVIHPEAISDQYSDRTIYLHPTNTGNNSLLFKQGRATEEVVSVSLDEFFNNESMGTPNIIKLDIEGFESHAIAGAYELLASEELRAVMLEFSPDSVSSTGAQPEYIFHDMESHGFEIKYAQGPKLGEKADLDFMLKQADKRKNWHTNLLCER